ncbi:phosphatidylinositol 4-phosphate 3-kinase C2 domain-containing subunit beta isoform X2 [Daktulosphaira vitifoliae]|uniref:phosphatidylinositol 4-phosphate 3-kinase C2 domain-containing subunit beta isoform X2 n=1 Tax=Daktulosphaira vitifoliae TaxID=58002 RepID=UPI0021AA0F92|nr:phosphatidylinositol 4-phosphate 3-kinase C2 domain-containing subunit beta isoform X2 [Daktulosphaira vitifoliae]
MKSTAKSECDKKFQEDLAQALNMETLALEEFRNRKIQSESLTINSSKTIQKSKITSFQSMSETTNYCNESSRVRPRPGSFNTKEPLVPRIKPPPRRNTTVAISKSNTNESVKDLVVLESPPLDDLMKNLEPFDFVDRNKIACSIDNSTFQNFNDNNLFNNSNLHYRQNIDSKTQILKKNLEKLYQDNFSPINYSVEKSNVGYQIPQQLSQQILPSSCWSTETLQSFSSNKISTQSELLMSGIKRNVIPVVTKKQHNNNLIDLNFFDSPEYCNKSFSNVRTSVLEAFDPLLFDGAGTYSQNDSDKNESFYATYDPFDYMYSPCISSQSSDPIYAAVIKTPVHSPPPVPPRSSTTPKESKVCKSITYENMGLVKRSSVLHDPDVVAFYNMVKQVRKKFIYTDSNTNTGIIVCSKFENNIHENISTKFIVNCKPIRNTPIIFTCDVGSSVEHVISQVICELDIENIQISDYFLKVKNFCEYMLPINMPVINFEYVHECIKLDVDVELCLVHKDDISHTYARQAQDDMCDNELGLNDLCPNEISQPITHDTLKILLDTLDGEINKMKEHATALFKKQIFSPLQPNGVQQAIKALTAFLGNIEPLDLTLTLNNFIMSCNEISNITQQDLYGRRTEVVMDDGADYSVVRLKFNESEKIDHISDLCLKIKENVQTLIENYCKAFKVDFQLNFTSSQLSGIKLSSEILDNVVVYISGLHRLFPSWSHDEYLIAGQIYHGTRPIVCTALSKTVLAEHSLYKRVVFDSWLEFENINVCLLPRECRLVLVVYGRTFNTEGQDASATVSQTELGWASLQFFNVEGEFAQGKHLLSLWPPCADKRLGPAPPPGTHPYSHSHPVLSVEVQEFDSRIIFPSINRDYNPNINDSFDFTSLDINTQEQLLDIIYQDTFTRPLSEDREVLWEKRYYLLSKPEALPKVLLAAHSWDYACLADLYSMLSCWAPIKPLDALQLFLPCFPDNEVRRLAVKQIQLLSNDQLIDFLPQLVQAIKHETYDNSPLAEILLEKSLSSPKIAHQLYWLLMQPLPGQSPQNTYDTFCPDDKTVSEARYYRRLQLLLRALIATCGEALRKCFMSQQLLMKELFDTAENLKASKESHRLKVLSNDLLNISQCLNDTPTSLPLSPSIQVNGIQTKSCFYFPSNTLPLKINFTSVEENVIIPAIFKVGDDLQQDMLTIQIIRIMDKLWLKEGLDLKMVTFACVPTGDKRGMIEMVTNAETLRKIQVELGLTGSFKDRPIAEWLAKHNPSALEYERAVANFTASCAGYSVATYILGICDRHNDNIMMKTTGHLFHIDFGKFLGDAQTFGNFKRDRTPFVLTSDMVYVINGGDKPSIKFHHFVDVCVQAFNIVRKHGNLLLNLFGLMASSGIPGVTMDAVNYVQKALLPELSNTEAAASFARMIENSIKSRFTQFNFFLHNLAQMRFNNEQNGTELLSFVPKVYTMSQEGKIEHVEVYGCQKRYDPEKYYVYILKVFRENQRDPSYHFRSYKEFSEFQQKLLLLFPLAKFLSLLNTSIHMGRSHIKQVAEKRRVEIQLFLNTLFQMAPEVSHSDLVYTFFHPLLRDQQEDSIDDTKLKEPKKPAYVRENRIRGQLKLTLHYQRGAFMIMIHHAKDLPRVAGNQEPSTYVKVYLLPDRNKATKRKTKVVKKNCFPSFMEMLEYRMPLEIVQYKVLQATIWSHDAFQENEFLGGVTIEINNIDLFSETTSWYNLSNMYR